jgi:putative DNA primase/helicase
MKPVMKPEQTRREQFIHYSAHLKERFDTGILSELQVLPQWVVWKGELEEGKRKKVPYNPNYPFLARASVKIPKSWGTLNQALTALESGEYSGLGFMLTPPLVMIDLDNSFDRSIHTITNPQAERIMRDVNSYFEASPNDGLKGLVYVDRPIVSLHTDAIEIYGKDRFTTITTDHIPGTPLTIEHRTEAVEALYSRFAPPVEEPVYQNTGGVSGAGTRLAKLPPEAAKDTLLQQLLRGDMTGYSSQSSADFVLIMKLLHWTGDDKALTRQLFLSSPLGNREKAERKTGDTTYVDLTIENVIKRRRNPPMRR